MTADYIIMRWHRGVWRKSSRHRRQTVALSRRRHLPGCRRCRRDYRRGSLLFPGLWVNPGEELTCRLCRICQLQWVCRYSLLTWGDLWRGRLWRGTRGDVEWVTGLIFRWVSDVEFWRWRRLSIHERTGRHPGSYWATSTEPGGAREYTGCPEESMQGAQKGILKEVGEWILPSGATSGAGSVMEAMRICSSRAHRMGLTRTAGGRMGSVMEAMRICSSRAHRMGLTRTSGGRMGSGV